MNKYKKMRLAVLICFIILFICLNHIINWAIVKYNNLNNMVEINNDNLSDLKKDKVYYWIEEFDIYGNIAKYLNFRGWSFAETEEDSSNRKVELILYNQDNQYAIYPSIHERETYRAFPDKKINGKMHGFYGKASLINLRDGIYDIYINDIENNKNYGLVYTRRYINKYGQNICISELDKVNTCINTLNTVNTNDIDFNIERIYIDDNYLNISGWAYLNGIQDNVRVLVGIKDNNTNREEYYTASRTKRNISKNSPENIKTNSDEGFRVKIPISDYKRYKISSIVIFNKGKYYKTEFKEIDTVKYQQQINLNSVQNENAINLYIEKNKKEGNELFIAGWAYLNNINKTGKIYAGLKDNAGNEIYYTLEQIERNDVMKQYNNADLLNSGFYGFIDLQEDYKLSSIIIEYEGKYYRKEIGKQETKVESVNKKNYSTISNINKQNIINSNNIFIYIEDNQKNNNQLSVLGWAYLTDINKTGKVYIGIKDKTGKETYYITEQTERPDVVKHFNNTDLLKSGFKANIELENNEEHTLSSIVIEYDNKYYKRSLSEQQIVELEKEKIIESNHLDLYVEKNEQQNNALFIEGWAYIKDIKKTGPIYIGVKDKAGKERYYITEQIERPDVVKHFNNADLLYSGFKANIKLEKNEKLTFSSIVIKDDNKYYKQNIDKNPIIKLEKEKIIESNHLDLYVEKNEQHNNALSIEGWAYLQNIGKTGQVYVGIKDKSGKETYYTADMFARPDVVQYFNNNADLLNCGYSVSIKVKNKEDYKLSSIVIEYGGKYYRKTVK